MIVLRVINPLLMRANALKILGGSYPAYQNLQLLFKRHKSGKETSLSPSGRAELDTNVKPLGEKVKETTKTASYLGIILIGVGVTGSLFYAVFRELFSSKSPNNVYTAAVKKCLADSRVEDKLGYPIKAFGEETRRGRRRHVSHVVFKRDDKQCIRMKFYLQGAFHRGTVQLEMLENESGKYEYRYLFVEVEDLARTVIVLEDNRNQFSSSSTQPFTDLTLGL